MMCVELRPTHGSLGSRLYGCVKQSLGGATPWTIRGGCGYFVWVGPVTTATRSGVGPSDTALVIAARAGEEWASEALFRRYAPMMNGLALRLLGRDDDGLDDLVQESCVQAWKSLMRVEAPQAFGPWLAAIVVRTASKVLRRRRLLVRLGLRRGQPIDEELLLSTDAPPDVAAELRAVYRLLESLPSGVRVPLVLRRVEGLPVAEIAQLTGMSMSTVKRRLAEGECRLNQGLGHT